MESLKESLMKPLDDTLSLLRTLGPQTPTAQLRVSRFFVAGSGVLTLAFDGFTAGLLGIKRHLARGLAPEYPGSTWPKITLAALADPVPLSDKELAVLWSATSYADSMILAEAPELEVSELMVVQALTRSLEMKGHSERIPLVAGNERTVPDEQRAYVDTVLSQWRSAPSERYQSILRKTGHGRQHYHRPCRAYTLVSYQSSPIPAVDVLRERLDRVLPGRYHWFEPSARHLTIRTLERATAPRESEFESIEFLAHHNLDA
ncbi:MAG: hypothetical protein ACI9W4_001683 [Rhodothermales bacterium]